MPQVPAVSDLDRAERFYTDVFGWGIQRWEGSPMDYRLITTGEEGEENWKALLKDWLPPQFQLVTRGRIIFRDGHVSPQMDLLILSPAYPPGLVHKKLYLLSLSRSCNLAGTNSPNWFICQHNICPI